MRFLSTSAQGAWLSIELGLSFGFVARLGLPQVALGHSTRHRVVHAALKLANPTRETSVNNAREPSAIPPSTYSAGSQGKGSSFQNTSWSSASRAVSRLLGSHTIIYGERRQLALDAKAMGGEPSPTLATRSTDCGE